MHCVHIQTNSFIIWSYPIQLVIAQHSSCNLIEANQCFIASLRCFHYFLPNLRTQVCCEPNTDPFISFLSDIPRPWKYAVLLFCTLSPATPKYEQLNHQQEKFQLGIRCILFTIHLCTKAPQYQTCYNTKCLNHVKYS